MYSLWYLFRSNPVAVEEVVPTADTSDFKVLAAVDEICEIPAAAAGVARNDFSGLHR